MKTIQSLTLGLALTAMTIHCGPVMAASTSELLQQGLYAEEVEGNLDAAIKAYGQVIRNGSAPRNQVAQALYRQGMCYLKLKDEAAARAALDRLVSEFPEQTAMIEKARPVLEDLSDFDPASLMPAGTLMYVELGSPGRQVETILNLLKGTPFENPLAAMAGPQGANGGKETGKSPGDIMTALLNPSMLAEFKKIHSSAVGITRLALNNPPSISVLYPGKSDALRGMILAALGVAGTPDKPIEGMQTVNIRNVAEVAYDDRVIIVARPPEQLAWSVKQYKGLNSDPSLATSNKSFARLSRSQRQSNALSVWANVDEIYGQLQQLFPAGQMPKGILSANAIGDFSHIDEFTLALAIEPTGLGLRTDLEFKDGHHCLAYDMIRTPNLSKAALEAVPSDAVAVACLSVNPADAAQVEKVRSTIQNVAGLDVGREIFSNLEQVTLFAMPAPASAAGAAAPNLLPTRLGLTITSRRPEQTLKILDTLLGTANSMAGSSAQPGTRTDKYKVGSEGGRDIYCYVDQIERTTVLSLSRQLNDAVLAAVRNHKSICAAGPLHDAISQLAPSASKLALVNAGGAIRLLSPLAQIQGLNDEQTREFHGCIDQLARATDSTTLELGTDEQLNHLTLNARVAGLPPLTQVLGPLTQIEQIAGQARAEAAAKRLRHQAPAVVLPAPHAPVIDGKIDDVWSQCHPYPLKNVFYGPAPEPADLSADYRALWDPSNLYVLVEVTDNTLRHDSAQDRWYEDDSVEVYIDARNEKSSSYTPTDYQYAVTWDKTAPVMQETKHNRMGGVQYAVVPTDKGYRVEIKFPWSTLGTTPATGAKIGLDVQVNDNDQGGKRDRKIAWHARQDDAWQNPRAFGNAELAGLVGWWKFDESSGNIAADSSGNGNNGSLEGHPTWRPQGGRLGGAIELHGSGDYVKIDKRAPFDITGQITLSAWVNIKTVPQEWTAVITKGDSAWRMSTEYAQDAFHFGLGQEDFLNGHQQVSPGQWHHVLCVYDGQRMSIYVDGQRNDTRSRVGPIASNDFPVCIGENLEATGRCWNGLIDDVRVYNYALNENQIKALAAGE